MRLLVMAESLTTVRRSVGNRVRLKLPARSGREALPPTTIWRLAAPPNWPNPEATSDKAKSRLPLTYVSRAFTCSHLRRVYRLPSQPGFAPWMGSVRRACCSTVRSLQLPVTAQVETAPTDETGVSS